jgi:hypothetical protein
VHFVRDVGYVSNYKPLLTSNDGITKIVDLKPYLKGDIFEPLKNINYFKTVKVSSDIDTIVWENGADIPTDFLYEIGETISETSLLGNQH